jgi:non-specific serine/threonine protein kinase
MSQLVGQSLNQYRIVEKLGEGGMGEVYRAHDERLDRDVAIKVLPQEYAEDEDRMRRFEREARATAALDHPNILAIHELGTHEGRPFIVTELLEGRTVREAIDSGDLANREVIEIGSQITKGLAAAHSKDIVHRDLKPSNLFITTDGTAKILDFGLAKLIARPSLVTGSDEAPTEQMETEIGSVLGTAGYMSPEQVRGLPADRRSDIFSLGVVLYEMLTGLSPFRRVTAADTASAVLSEDPPAVSDTTSWVTPAFDGVVRRCLQKRPDDRFQSADEVRRALLALVATPDPPKRRRRLMRPAVMATIIIPLVLVAVFAFTLAHLGYRAMLEGNGNGSAATEALRIVVLPFDNLGPADDAFFADGVTEEITSRLASVGGIQVISRTTARRYAETEKSATEIGAELDVDYLLEGSVRWARMPDGAQRVRLTPRLIRIADDSQLWTEPYDRELVDVFEVQSEIAERVADELGVTLLESERAVVRARPTENLDAYQAYLRGRWLASQPHFSVERWQRMMESYELAVTLDPDFALAHSKLARAHAQMRYFGHDLSSGRLEAASAAAERAVALAPTDPRVHLDLAYYHLLAHRDTGSAMAEIATARQSLGEDAEVLKAEIFLNEIRGRYQETIELADRAARLSPLDPSIPSAAIFNSWALRDYHAALRYAEVASELAPDSFWPPLGKAVNLWSMSGNLNAARSALEGLPDVQNDWITWSWMWQEIFERRFDLALRRIDAMDRPWLETKFVHRPRPFLRAMSLEFQGRRDDALPLWREALSMIDDALRAGPDHYHLHSSLGVTLAGLGDHDRAMAEGRRGMELLPVSRDSSYGLSSEVDMAWIFTLLGERDLALDQLDRLMTIPSWITPAWIEMDPRWDSLRDHPRYAKTLASHRNGS